jgi:hypothetical protein
MITTSQFASAPPLSRSKGKGQGNGLPVVWILAASTLPGRFRLALLRDDGAIAVDDASIPAQYRAAYTAQRFASASKRYDYRDCSAIPLSSWWTVPGLSDAIALYVLAGGREFSIPERPARSCSDHVEIGEDAAPNPVPQNWGGGAMRRPGYHNRGGARWR